MTGDIDLFLQYRMGDLTLPNRIVMAPMTRNRAGDADVPVPLMVTYYVQRDSAGLIITEGSQVSPQGVGYTHTPGIYSGGTGRRLEESDGRRPQSWRQDFRKDIHTERRLWPPHRERGYCHR